MKLVSLLFLVTVAVLLSGCGCPREFQYSISSQEPVWRSDYPPDMGRKRSGFVYIPWFGGDYSKSWNTDRSVSYSKSIDPYYGPRVDYRQDLNESGYETFISRPNYVPIISDPNFFTVPDKVTRFSR